MTKSERRERLTRVGRVRVRLRGMSHVTALWRRRLRSLSPFSSSTTTFDHGQHLFDGIPVSLTGISYLYRSEMLKALTYSPSLWPFYQHKPFRDTISPSEIRKPLLAREPVNLGYRFRCVFGNSILWISWLISPQSLPNERRQL